MLFLSMLICLKLVFFSVLVVVFEVLLVWYISIIGCCLVLVISLCLGLNWFGCVLWLLVMWFFLKLLLDDRFIISVFLVFISWVSLVGLSDV